MASRRETSKAIFGNADRLDVALRVASAEQPTFATELSRELNISQNRARAQLVVFADAGLLRELPRDGFRVYYERNNEKFWAALRDIGEAFE